MKESIASATPPTIAFGAWLGSFTLHGLLSDVALAAGIVGALYGMYWARKLNMAKLAQLQQQVCRDCEAAGLSECPLPPEDRPAKCPKDL